MIIDDFNIPKGKYVVAVSGGVDSMVLLFLMNENLNQTDIVVAHFRHNVRSSIESDKDLEVISSFCKSHNLTLETDQYTGINQSEAALRKARYAFLEKVARNHNFNSIVTAHHKDDLVESAVINLLRGTGGKGLNSISNNKQLVRPLLETPKKDILSFAKINNIKWHEDSTNQDETILRNYIRRKIVPKLRDNGKFDEFYRIIAKQKPLEGEIAQLVNDIDNANNLRYQNNKQINKRDFIRLPHDVAKRVMVKFLNSSDDGIEITNNLIEKVVVFAKTAHSGCSMDLSLQSSLMVRSDYLEMLIKD